jgi:hypothetical protein
MVHEDMFRMFHGLQACANLTGAKFVYACAKNERALKAICEDLQKAIEPDKEYQAFAKALEELSKKKAQKDEHNKPIMAPESTPQKPIYEIDDYDTFDALVDKLETSDEHGPAVEKYKKALEDYQDLLKEKGEVEIYVLGSFADVPKEITGRQMSAILEMIPEPEV